MARTTSGFSRICKSLGTVVCMVAFVCLQAPLAKAQHGGGGHVGGGAHVAAPHVSTPHAYAPPAYHPLPMRSPAVASRVPVVRLMSPPGATHLVNGNHVIISGAMASPLESGTPSHVVIGFPPAEEGNRSPLLRNPGSLSFSGQGREIWQNPVAGGPQERGTENSERGEPSFVGRLGASPSGVYRFPRRPIPGPFRPVFPIFGPPVFVWGLGFGGPFGWGWGLNSAWGPSCGPFWGWDFGCNALPFYDYGYGNYNYAPSDDLEAQVENWRSEPQIYEPPPSPTPLYEGAEQRQLVQLYLKDGTVYNVTDYWLVNDKLHFTTIDPGSRESTEQVIDFDQLDLQRTIDVNTSRGFRFVLRNEPLEQYLQGTDQNQNPPESAAPPAPPEPGRPLPPPQPVTPPQPQP